MPIANSYRRLPDSAIQRPTPQLAISFVYFKCANFFSPLFFKHKLISSIYCILLIIDIPVAIVAEKLQKEKVNKEHFIKLDGLIYVSVCWMVPCWLARKIMAQIDMHVASGPALHGLKIMLVVSKNRFLFTLFYILLWLCYFPSCHTHWSVGIFLLCWSFLLFLL